MKKEIEVPMRVKTVRETLGVGESYMTRLLAAMGRSGSRMIKLSAVVNWLDEHPHWRSTHESSQPADTAE